MASETILQHWLFTRFAFPFLLIFFIVFAILEKVKLLGDDKRQLNALVAFIIGLIFVTFAYPVEVVSNLILFLTVALVVVFVSLLIWGFVSGESKIESKGVRIALGVVVAIAVIAAVVWSTGFTDPFTDWLFRQEWSGMFWTNIFFVVVIAIALALVLKTSSGSSK